MNHAITIKDLLYVGGGTAGLLAIAALVIFIFLGPWIFWDGH